MGSLYVQVIGQGMPLVLLHGWGMHSGLLRDLAEDLAHDFQVYLVDLPGHGRSAPLSVFDRASVLRVLERQLPDQAHWVGWSLGGLLAMALSTMHPRKVRSLTLLASSPCFVENRDWPGISSDLLEQMGRDFVADYQLTLDRFVGLQVFGQDRARQLSRQIHAKIQEAPPAEPGNLGGALNLLKSLDLRRELAESALPMLFLFGARDRLVPGSVAAAVVRVLPFAKVSIIEGAAHLPFMTHEGLVANEIRCFLATLEDERVGSR
jgi:pimeloyl-[acyl-carrier protein] methyl ester esterase